ncbi:hypothetical protein Tco_1094636 [Tanacetum coccineum]|uniref:Uncharacterized protein n=1 Tax=Tanacetum coccineum TaxID=301880 RepID=A0ABQ5IGA4_9ASTR
MYICLKDHLDAQERKQDKSTLETPVDFEGEILDAEVQENEAIPLSDEEITLDAASSEGLLLVAFGLLELSLGGGVPFSAKLSSLGDGLRFLSLYGGGDARILLGLLDLLSARSVILSRFACDLDRLKNSSGK